MAPRHSSSNTLAERSISALGVVAPPPIHVQSPKFEGSLATLFTCVRDHKIDLLDVPLLPICEAYFAYMLADVDLNLDEAAAALTALAYLLERKAWALLPLPEAPPECEEFPELPIPTAYEYNASIEALRLWHDERSNLFFRSSNQGFDPYELPYTLADVGPADLANALKRVLERAMPTPPVQLGKAGRSLALQMGAVLLAVSFDWKSLDRLVPMSATREDAVFWFLSLLELMRLGQVQARLTGEEVEFSKA